MTQGVALPKLIVEDGLHRLASMSVPLGETGVGSDAVNAVVVSDMSAAMAFTLTWNGQSVALAAVGADAAVGRRALPRGGLRKFKQSSSFTCGGVAFRIEIPNRSKTGALAPGWARRSLAAGVVCTVALAATATLLAAPSSPISMYVADVSSDSVGSVAVKDVVISPAKPAEP